jgi:hypothetical protein
MSYLDGRLPAMSTLAFYARSGVLTSAGRYAALFEPLPGDVAALAAVGHGLLIHEHLAHAYGVTLSEQDRHPVHLRGAEQLLEQVVTRDDRPLDVARPPAGRVPGNCRHFTVLMVAMLRARGTPARARCGFGNYFGTGYHEDHWVCEYWDAGRERWVLVDAQIDGRQRALFPIDFDVTDVPRDRFVIAGDAWARCRAGEDDPDRYGLSMIPETGDWWIAANLMRDAVALDNVELLPWDVWGAMPEPETVIDADHLALYDRLAVLTHSPDAHLAELRELCRDDPRVRVPPTVRNAARRRQEQWSPG